MSAPDPPDREPRAQVAWPGLGYWARTTIVIVLVVGVLLQLRRAADVFVLVLMALVLAVGLDPAVRFLERRGMGRGLATAVIFVSSTVAFGVFLWFAIPEFVEQVRTFARDLPALIDDLAARDDCIGEAVRNADVKTHLQDIIADAPSRVASSFGSILGVTSRITGMLFRLLTVAILTIYFVLSYPAARRTLVHRAPANEQARLERVVTTITARIGGYVSGSFIQAGLSAAVTAVALIALGVGFWFPLAAWAGFASLIPIVGAYLGGAPAVLIALADSPGKALVVLLFFVIWQQVRDYFVGPRIMKNSVDLSPAAVMLATIIGGSLGGIFGVLLALPVAAAIKAVMAEYLFADLPDPDVDPTNDETDPEPV
jgi:predicted PurR-regulated permease PerM